MRNDLTDITIILDRSGSMSIIAADTIRGLNTFLDKQRTQPGDLLLTLVQFDDINPYEVVYNGVNVKNVPNLEASSFIPRGSTPLLDAVGRGIIGTGSRLRNIKEEDRPGLVVFVIVTDGQENASKEFTKAKIAEMIKEQTDKYSWSFIFIGANQDAITTAKDLNIDVRNSINYSATAKGTQSIYASLGANLCSARVAGPSGQSLMNWSDEDRAAQN